MNSKAQPINRTDPQADASAERIKADDLKKAQAAHSDAQRAAPVAKPLRSARKRPAAAKKKRK